MSTHFKNGDRVKALSSAQGLQAGRMYEVVHVDELCLAWGTYVEYLLREGDRTLPVINGHLLLERVAL